MRASLPEVVAEACEIAQRPSATTADGIRAVTILIVFGFVERAYALLLELLRRPPAGQLRLLKLCRYLVAGRSLLQPGRQEDFGVMVAHNPEASRVVIVFPGKGGRFWGFNESVLLNRTDTSFVFLRDNNGCFYLDGIKGLGRSYAECRDALLRIVARIARPGASGAKPPLHCIGHSVGGYAALRFGLDLYADGVLAFSAPTNLDLREIPRASLEKHPDILELHERAPSMAVDLRALYRAAPRTPKLELCYAQEHPNDAASALRMQGLPGVNLHPLTSFDGHDTLLETMKSGVFKDLVNQTLEPDMTVQDAGSEAPT